MKHFLLPIIAAAVLSTAAFASPPVTVVDGDTIYYGEEKIRIVGLDAPETYQARCESERALGQRATGYFRALVQRGPVTIQRQNRPDRYGRTLARVYIDGRDVADIMVSEGFAVRYDCPRNRCPRRVDWCERLKVAR